MKKTCLFVLSLCVLIASMSVFSFAADDAVATAKYAQVKPTIDGKIDEVWNDCDKIEATQADGAQGNDKLLDSYTSVMWDENGLYLLGVCYDETYPESDAEARNSIDFWVSETNTATDNYDEEPGDWHYCKASTGEEVYYTGNENVYKVSTTAAGIYKDHFVVEIFVPWQTENFAPAEGHQIAYAVSFNDDEDGDGARDTYAFTTLSDAAIDYWASTLALPCVTLVGAPAPAVEDTTAAPEVPADVDAPADDVVSAPATFDAGIIAIAAMVVSAAGVALSSKKH